MPTVLAIHGGGFCIGTARDDDEWNRGFADSQNTLVISLSYSKAPRAPFPTGLHDLEALYLAVLGDESLPIDRANHRGKGKVALLGFDAGGNLAISLSQLPRIRRSATPPTAVVSVSGYLDLARPVAEKLRNRPYKPDLAFPRNSKIDSLAATHEAYVWSYTPYGHDLQDPLLSPAFARWQDETGAGLPAHVCLVGAELDCLAHESWRMACRLVREGGQVRHDERYAQWRVPEPASDDVLQRVCGTKHPSKAHWQGELELSDLTMEERGQADEDGVDMSKRYGFEVCWESTSEEEGGSVKWILVPDELHGFDRRSWRAGVSSAETARDAEEKTRVYVDAVGRWLLGTVWKT